MVTPLPSNCPPVTAFHAVNALKQRRAVFIALALLILAMFAISTSQAQVVRTGYTAIVAANSAKCIDISGGSTAAGAAAIQWHCNFGSNEEWTVQPYNGSFRVVVQKSGACLVVSGASTAAGAALVQEPCTGVNSELWSFVANGGNFQIVNKNSGQCASVNGGSVVDGAALQQNPCSTGSNFLFTFLSGLIASSSLSVMQAAHSGQCMNVSGSSTTPGGSIIQWPCAGSTNEQWTLVPTGSYFEVVAHNSGLCLSDNGSTALSTNIGAGDVQQLQ